MMMMMMRFTFRRAMTSQSHAYLELSRNGVVHRQTTLSTNQERNDGAVSCRRTCSLFLRSMVSDWAWASSILVDMRFSTTWSCSWSCQGTHDGTVEGMMRQAYASHTRVVRIYFVTYTMWARTCMYTNMHTCIYTLMCLSIHACMHADPSYTG